MISILAVAGVLVLASSVPAAELFRATDVAIYDATGKKVGTPVGGVIVGVNTAQVVFRTSRGLHFITVGPAAFSGNAHLGFTGPRCTGSRFISKAIMPGQSPSSVRGPRQTLYAPAGAFTLQSMTSYYTYDGRCINRPYYVDWARTTAVLDFADYFTAPFALGATRGEPIPTGAVADELDPTDGLVMFDATGKRGGPADAFVAVTDSGITFPLALGRGLYFQSDDCSGTPSMWGSGALLFPGAIGVGARKTVYVRSEEPRYQTMYSKDVDGDCEIIRTWHGGGHEVRGLAGYFAPATPVGIDLADYFTEPFTTRVGSGIRSLPRPD